MCSNILNEPPELKPDASSVSDKRALKEKNQFFLGMRRFIRWLANSMLHLLFRIQYEGLEHLPTEGPAILIANHTSLFDMFAIHVRVEPWIHWVAKKELYRHLLLSKMLHFLGCIPVDRNKTDLSAARGILTHLKQNRIVGIFPQGTRVRPEEVAKVHPRNGAIHFAIRTGVPLLPVAIEGRFKPFSKVRIVFGQPFTLARDLCQIEQGQMEILSLHIMQKIYDLIGCEDVYGLRRHPEGQTS